MTEYLTGAEMGARCLYCKDRPRAHGSQFCGELCEQAFQAHHGGGLRAHPIHSRWSPQASRNVIQAAATRREIERERRRLRAKAAHARRRLGEIRTGMDARSIRLACVDEDLLHAQAQLEEDL